MLRGAVIIIENVIVDPRSIPGKKLFAFHFALMPSRMAYILLFLLIYQLIVGNIGFFHLGVETILLKFDTISDSNSVGGASLIKTSKCMHAD